MEINIQRWHQNAWQNMATVMNDDGRQFHVIYESDHANAHCFAIDARALSVAVPVTWQAHQFDQWPAFLRDLIPQGESRKRLTRLLNVPDAPESDWTLLAHGAGNPIGHLRVKEAAEFQAQHLPHLKNAVGWTLDEITQRDQGFLDEIERRLGPTPGGGSQGEWPKVLLTEGQDGLYYLDHMLPDTLAVKHWVVKLPRLSDPVYGQILQAEAAYHQLACDMGMGKGKTIYHQGALFIERFDRHVTAGGQVDRYAQESLYAACGTLGATPELTHLQACKMLANVTSVPHAAILEYVKRDVFNLAFGNRDNHGRNIALQRFDGDDKDGIVRDGLIQLTPHFDFAPMMLHPDGLTRRMRWQQEYASQPDWRHVATLLDEAELCPYEVLMAQIPQWRDQLAATPALLEQYDCPDYVMRRIKAPFDQTLKTLTDAMEWTNDFRP